MIGTILKLLLCILTADNTRFVLLGQDFTSDHKVGHKYFNFILRYKIGKFSVIKLMTFYETISRQVFEMVQQDCRYPAVRPDSALVFVTERHGSIS